MEDLLIITPRWRWTSLDGSVVHTGADNVGATHTHEVKRPTASSVTPPPYREAPLPPEQPHSDGAPKVEG